MLEPAFCGELSTYCPRCRTGTKNQDQNSATSKCALVPPAVNSKSFSAQMSCMLPVCSFKCFFSRMTGLISQMAMCSISDSLPFFPSGIVICQSLQHDSRAKPWISDQYNSWLQTTPFGMTTPHQSVWKQQELIAIVIIHVTAIIVSSHQLKGTHAVILLLLNLFFFHILFVAV